MALEAAWFLALSRIATLGHPSRYTKRLGDMQGTPIAAPPDQVTVAAEIGHVVTITAAAMPFRAVCLQQAMAVRRMLDRRGIPATVHLGLSRDPAKRNSDTSDTAAHAWVVAGDRVVNGDINLDDYVIVGTFA